MKNAKLTKNYPGNVLYFRLFDGKFVPISLSPVKTCLWRFEILAKGCQKVWAIERRMSWKFRFDINWNIQCRKSLFAYLFSEKKRGNIDGRAYTQRFTSINRILLLIRQSKKMSFGKTREAQWKLFHFKIDLWKKIPFKLSILLNALNGACRLSNN